MFKWIKAIFFKVTKALGSFFKQVFTSGFQVFLAEVKDFAKQVVSRLETADLSNNEKREQAFKEILDYILSKKIYYKNNWVYIVIGLALEAIRNTET